LAQKLGINPGTTVLLDGAPPSFDLGPLPDAVRIHRRLAAGPFDVIVCFCPSSARLLARWPVLHRLTTPAGALWIAWPKRAARTLTDLSENVVREYALRNGRVDVKVCAIDDLWSGLKHVIRKEAR
jgi:hypothetical protein